MNGATMRSLCLQLLLCSAAATASAECSLGNSRATGPASAPPATVMQVKATTPAPAATQPPAEVLGLETLRQGPLGAPLVVGGLLMLVIALRRGSR